MEYDLNSDRMVPRGGLYCQDKAKFTIILTTDEREKPQARARKYTSPYRDVIRAKIILLAAQGLSNEVIAAHLDTPRQIVSKWRKRFAVTRLPGLEELPRGGRPALFYLQHRGPSKSRSRRL